MPFFEPGNFTAGGLIGLVLGTYLGHVLTIRRNNTESMRKGYNEAAKNFRESFTCVFEAFPDGMDRTGYIVINNFDKQNRVMIEFARFLEGSTKSKFEKAWNDYSQYNQKFYDGSAFNCGEEKLLNEFKKFIEKLMEFAKHK